MKNKEENMQSIAFLKICLSGNDKSYYLWNNAQKYYDKLNHALEDIKKEEQPASYLYFSFISLSSATLEYSLNLLYAMYFFNKFGVPLYKRYLESHKSISFRNKLFILPHVLSEGKLVINENCRYVESLNTLISIRNDLLHNSEKAQEFEFPDIHAIVEGNNLIVPIEYAQVEWEISPKDNAIESLNKKLCIEVGEAMSSFYKMVLVPYIDFGTLEENDFIRAYLREE